MSRMLHLAAVAVATLTLASAASAAPAQTDRYAAAVAHGGRSADDRKRDAIDHPAEILRLTGIDAGMRVADVMGGDGYFSELASYLVGPSGHVLLVNNPSFERWSQKDLATRFAGKRLASIEHTVADSDKLGLGSGTLDAILFVKVMHDFYWVSADKKNWPDVDPNAVLDQLVAALKPGGVLLVIDHSAATGAGSGDATKLHRIEDAFARKQLEARGLKVIATSDLLRRPDDKRDRLSYEPPALGHTDKFVLVLQKPKV